MPPGAPAADQPRRDGPPSRQGRPDQNRQDRGPPNRQGPNRGPRPQEGGDGARGGPYRGGQGRDRDRGERAQGRDRGERVALPPMPKADSPFAILAQLKLKQ